LNILTDTHTIYWAIANPTRLSKPAAQALVDASRIYVSVVILWELIIKMGRQGALSNDPLVIQKAPPQQKLEEAEELVKKAENQLGFLDCF
jgi:PIN domain nuclease of toxin-antitoxin system